MLVYSQDGLGLGHQRRTSRIIEQLLIKSPLCSALTICDSPLGQVFCSPPMHAYTRIPTIVKVDNGVWGTLGLSNLSQVKGRRQKMMAKILNDYVPDVFLVDHMPQGAMGELIPIVEIAKRLGSKLVLGLRDILDHPETIINRWQREDAYLLLKNYYDHILIYGQQEIFDTSTIYQLPFSVPTTYCGYVSPLLDDNKVDTKIRRELFQNAGCDTKLILVSFGGGADAAELMKLIFKALKHVLQRYCIVSVIITGPFNPAPIEGTMDNSFSATKLIRRTDNILPYMKAADLIISMGGYNTITEILYSQTQALVIPRNGPSMEQKMRVRCLEQLGLMEYISDKNLNDADLSQKIESLLACPGRKQEGVINLGGASNAASVLAQL